MSKLIVLLLVGGSLLGGCFLEDDPTIFGEWSASQYGDGGTCYTALGGETVHVEVRYDGGDVSEDYDCDQQGFQISVPRDAKNATLDVWGDGSVSSYALPTVVNKNLEIGHVSID